MTANYPLMECLLSEVLGLSVGRWRWRSGHATSGVPKFTGTEPSGCSFWRIARVDARSTPSQRSLQLPDRQLHAQHRASRRSGAPELDQDASLMAKNGYIKMEEGCGHPSPAPAAGIVVYAPLGTRR